jgi:iron complex transport system ATP-binding protein
MIGRPALLATDGLAVALGGRRVVEDVSLELAPGEIVAVAGPNGAGKTTLLKAMAGLLPIAAGTVTLGGVLLPEMRPAVRARRIAYLPQGHVFHWPMPVADIVALGRLPHGAGLTDLSSADRDAVERAMRATGVAEFADRPVTTLSGGERARVALARVLAVEAEIVLADEPVTSLDPRFQLTVLNILRDLARAGRAVVVVLHDLGLAARHADRMIALSAGRMVAEGPPDAVLSAALLRDVFGVEAYRAETEHGPVVVPWRLV